MLQNNKFNGKLKGKEISDFRKQLDYTVQDSQTRNENLYKILYTEKEDGEYLDEFFIEYFDQVEGEYPHFKVELNQNDGLSNTSEVCKALEQMANYLLFCDECKNEESEYPYLNNNDRIACKKREESYDEIVENVSDKTDIQFDKKLQNRNIKLKPKMKINKNDIKNNEYIRDLQEQINYYYKVYKEEEIKGAERNGVLMLNCSKTMKALRQEQISIKVATNKPIEMKGLLKDETVPDYDSDTGYYVGDDYVEVSFNRIDLGNPKHISCLLKNYTELRENSYDDFNSDIKYILNVLEDMMDKTNLTDLEKDILMFKIEKQTAKEIKEFILQKYNIETTEANISRTINNYIPKKVAETYLNDYAEWFYTYKAKADFKRCNKCNEVKLANANNFTKRSENKDKLHNTCKKCVKKSNNMQ